MRQNSPIGIYPSSIVYIACPADAITGGPELLHQLCAALCDNGIDSRMVYFGKDNAETPEPYRKYNCRVDNSINDNQTNVLVVPEVNTRLLFAFARIRKAIWWLSVDNYLKKEKPIKKIARNCFPFLQKKGKRMYRFSVFDPKVTHLVQSRYAERFVQRHARITPLYLSDYLNNEYFEHAPSYLARDREKAILYNPKKGIEIAKKIMPYLAEYAWIPLSGMTPSQMRETMAKSRVYIDFGPHPGKDRIPREAAIQGCCVITGLRGSASYYGDVPIPERYKLHDGLAGEDLAMRIRDTIENYDRDIQDFAHYRDMIRSEREVFLSDVKSVFTMTTRMDNLFS